MANFDVEAYYAEQDERMNLPDDDTDEYIKRMSSLRQCEMFNGDASLRIPPALLTPASPLDRAPKQDQASVSETTSEDLSGDVRTIKRKQSDISQEETVSKRTRVHSQDSIQNNQRVPSPQHTLNKDLSHMSSHTPVCNVQEPIFEMYDTLGPQVTSESGTSAPNEVPSSSENQCLMEKDFISGELPESLTNSNLAVKRKSSDFQLGPVKQAKLQQGSSSSSSIPTSDNDRAASDSEMLEPIDSFTVDLFGPSLPSRSMTLQAKSDPVRRVVRNKLSSSRSNTRNERRSEEGRSPQPTPQSVTTNTSPITSFSKSFPKKNAAVQEVEHIVAKHPQLNLQPLCEVGFARPKPKSKAVVAPTKTIHNPKSHLNPPTSPIEEISVVLSPGAPDNQSKSRMATSKISELYLEVKERIAKHSSTKQRNRLLKRGSSKMTAPADESSIIYVSSSPSSRASSPIPAPKNVIAVTSKREQKRTKQPVENRLGKGKKEKPQPMTPTEYARSLNENLAAASNAADSSSSKPKKRTPIRFLEGKHIFYAGGDMKYASEMTRGRMNLIVKYGGHLMPEYDPNITTHIVTDALMRPTLRALGLKTLNDIPDHIPTVRWNWVLTVIGRETLTKEEIDAKLRDVWMHAAFSERMDAGYTPYIPKSLSSFRMKGKERAVATNHDEGPSERGGELRPENPSSSIIQPLPTDPTVDLIRYSGALPSPPTSPSLPGKFGEASTSKLILSSNDEANGKDDRADPLAQFYGKARAQQKLKEDGWSSVGELDLDDSDGEETDDDDFSRLVGPIPKRGWTCDNKEIQKIADCPNQDIIDKLTELMELHKSKMGDDDHLYRSNLSSSSHQSVENLSSSYQKLFWSIMCS